MATRGSQCITPRTYQLQRGREGGRARGEYRPGGGRQSLCVCRVLGAKCPQKLNKHLNNNVFKVDILLVAQSFAVLHL